MWISRSRSRDVLRRGKGSQGGFPWSGQAGSGVGRRWERSGSSSGACFYRLSYITIKFSVACFNLRIKNLTF